MRKNDRATTARACFIGRDPRRIRVCNFGNERERTILDGARNIILFPKSELYRTQPGRLAISEIQLP